MVLDTERGFKLAKIEQWRALVTLYRLSTSVRAVSTPFEMEQSHQTLAASSSAQLSYFNQKDGGLQVVQLFCSTALGRSPPMLFTKKCY